MAPAFHDGQRVGGAFLTRVELEDEERVVRRDWTSFQSRSYFFAPMGQFYITNKRLIFSPLQVIPFVPSHRFGLGLPDVWPPPTPLAAVIELGIEPQSVRSWLWRTWYFATNERRWHFANQLNAAGPLVTAISAITQVPIGALSGKYP